MTIKERLACVETKLRYLEKLLYGIMALILAQTGIQIMAYGEVKI